MSRPTIDRTDLIEDLDWLIQCGETHPETLLRRTGWNGTIDALEMALRRADRRDLANRFHHLPATYRETWNHRIETLRALLCERYGPVADETTHPRWDDSQMTTARRKRDLLREVTDAERLTNYAIEGAA